MTTRPRTALGRIFKNPLSTNPMLNVGLLTWLVILLSAQSCSNTEEYGDDTVTNINYYCPDVPKHVVCKNGTVADNNSSCCDTTTDNSTTTTDNSTTSDNSTTTDNSTEDNSSVAVITTNYFLYNFTGWGAGKMYWGKYTASKDNWYIDTNSKIQKGCMPATMTMDNGSQGPHYETAHYWSRLSRNSEPPYARCYKAWMTDNATGCFGQANCINIGKTQFKRTMMVGQSIKFDGWTGPQERWGPGHQADNDSLIGESMTCASYPNGMCTTAYSTMALMDNHTGQVLDNGSFNGSTFPLGAVGESATHVCTYDNGSSCAYSD